MTLDIHAKNWISLSVVALSALCTNFARAQTVPADASSVLASSDAIIAAADQSLESNNTTTSIGASLGVNEWTVQQLAPTATATNGITVDLQLDQTAVALLLTPHSLRTDDFQVNLHAADGSMTSAQVEPSQTYRGVIVDQPGSAVAASIVDGQMTAIIYQANRRQWSVQPLTNVDPMANVTAHVVFDVDDSIASSWTCGVEDNARPLSNGGQPRGVMTTCSPIVATLAIVSDFDYYQNNSSDPVQTTNAIEAIINAVSIIYERQLGIRYELGQVDIWSGGNPIAPVSVGGGEINTNTWLVDFRDWYNANLPAVSRRYSHMFSGLDFGGSTIGLAYVGVACNQSSGYGVNQIRENRFASNVSLVAHESGHNWGANHCDGFAGCDIMNSVSSSSSVDTTFGPNATADIIGAGAPLFSCITPVDLGDDCNLNGVCDALEITSGMASDGNSNGIPDDCERVNNTTQNTYFFNITDAIIEANNGDTLIVAPGTYNESIDYLGKAITLQSSGGRDVTIIDVTGFGTRGVILSSGSIDGFTVRGASGGSFSNAGAGIEVLSGTPTINNCIVRDNIMPAGFFGGGVFVTGAGSNPTIANTIFCNNSPTDTQGPFTGGGGLSFPATCPPLASCGSAIGDVNEDGSIDGSDIQSFADCYVTGSTSNGDCQCADIASGSGINAADLSAFVGLLVGP